MRDALLKGRTGGPVGNQWNRGEKSGHAKLTEVKVRQIRAEHAEGCTYASLGDKYHVASQTAADICLYKTWRHI